MKNRFDSFLKPFKELRLLDKKLHISIIAYFTYLISNLIAASKFLLSSLLDGNFWLYEVIDLFVFENLIKVLALIFLYYSISNKQFSIKQDKERYLFTYISTVFILNYLCSFYFVERLASLKPTGASSLPDEFSQFLPFDWFSISYSYESIIGPYVSNWEIIDFVFSSISALSILVSIYTGLIYYKSNPQNINFRPSIRILTRELNSITRNTLVAVVIITFSFLSVENIKKNDYYSIQLEAEFMQDDLKIFQEQLISANQLDFSVDQVEARKVAANSVYSEISRRSERLQSIKLSLWSENQRDLKSGLMEWMNLWDSFVKQTALNGFAEAETVFELNQKYIEVAKLGVNRAPTHTPYYQVDFWNKEFIPLVR